MAEIIARFKHGLANGEFNLDVDLRLPASGINVLFGRSGSGKTSLLRCMAGLDRAPDGFMQLGETVWQDDAAFVPVYRRQIGYIFQDANLFSHLTARQNLNYAARRAVKNSDIEFEPLVELLGIGGLLERYPAQLSGGEKQRIALARALLTNPKLLLMDEPLASLDTERKQEILAYLERLAAQYAIPIVYVTHSMDEMARLADHLVIIDAGRVVAQGSLAEILPRLDLPVKLGEDMGVVIDATISELDAPWQLAKATFNGGGLWIADEHDAIGQKIRLRILARDVSLSLHADGGENSILNGLKATILAVQADAHPAMSLVQLQVGEMKILARITAKSVAKLQLEIGQDIWANVKSVSVIR